MRFARFCSGAAACFSLVAPAHAADPSADLIRAVQAGRTTTYEGVVLYRGDQDYDVLRVQHRYKDGSERERMVSQTGEPRQLVRIDNRLICILPKDQTVHMDLPSSVQGFLTQLNAERVQQLAQWYEFRSEGLGRVAGHMCKGIAVLPRDQYRYGYEVWADQDSGLPLKTSLIGPHGEVLEQVMFTEVSFPGSIADSAFDTDGVDPDKYNLVSSTMPSLDAAVEPGQPQLTFESLPPGFKVVAREQHPLPDGQPGQVEHLLLSDGLSSVSVFSAIEHAPTAKPFLSRLGAMEAYGREAGSYHITIVGEVPTPAIRLIGDGVHPAMMFEVPEGDPPAAAAPAPASPTAPPAQ